MPEFAGFVAGICRPWLTQMSKFADANPVSAPEVARCSCRGEHAA